MECFTRGIRSPWQPDALDADGDWHRAVARDARLFPARGNGRRMRHPYLDPIVYPEQPHRTVNFGYDVLTRAPVVLARTADSTAVARFPDRIEDVVIREVWAAEELSTKTEFFHALRRYWTTTLPPGRFIGWEAPDLSPKRFAIQLLAVRLGQADDEMLVEELGRERPYFMREALTVEFKMLREVEFPAGVAGFVGL